VTTLSRSIAAIEHNLVKYGLASRCARVRACDVAVLELEEPRSNARGKIRQEIELALREDAAEATVLGCAGMAEFANDLSKFAGAPVVEGVGCAVLLAESLARLDLRTSKIGGCAAPMAKNYLGSFKQFSPR
jgi:allantoin racemase